MHVLEKAATFASERLSDGHAHLFGKRSIVIRIATLSNLKVINKIVKADKIFSSSFETLEAGGAGKLKFADDGEHGGAVELLLGEEGEAERLFIGQYTKTSYSKLFGSDKFHVSFPKDDKLTLETFYKGNHMPDHFMGIDENDRVIEGKNHKVIITKCVKGDRSEIEVIMGTNEKLQAWEELLQLDSCQQIGVATLRQAQKFVKGGNVQIFSTSAQQWFDGTIAEAFQTDCVFNGYSVKAGTLLVVYSRGSKYVLPEDVGSVLRKALKPHEKASALFFGEFMALNEGLREMDEHERAFALDFIIYAFVCTGVLGEWSAGAEILDKWRKSIAEMKLPPDGSSLRLSDYIGLLVTETRLAEHIEIALQVLKCLQCHCWVVLEPVVAAAKEDGQWPPVQEEPDAAEDVNDEDSQPRDMRRLSSIDGALGNALFIAAHLGAMAAARRSSSISESAATRKSTGFSESGRASRAGSVSKSLAEDPEALMELVRRCVDTSANLCRARSKLLSGMAKDEKLSENARQTILHYSNSLPVSRRTYRRPAVGDDLPEANFTSLSSEMFSTLECDTYPEKVLESLGSGTGDYRALATNSKSGEFFFLSSDGKYLVKTLSENEGLLLYKMLPKYQEHIRNNPDSLICRFAGLFCVQIPGSGKKYFVVMTSVFDPRCKIHDNYDLKGSLHNRKKKEGESTGKDEDWITDEMRLRLPDNTRRRLLAIHEIDVMFLMQFKVMDYSLLVGIHHTSDGEAVNQVDGKTKYGGLTSIGNETIYFVGIIDFLIGYGANKQAEHLIRAVQGHDDVVSCVDPETYAQRQVQFVREKIADEKALHDRGTAGTLTVNVLSAKNLINADYFSKSDPYCTVRVGLQRAKTHTIMDNLSPEWDCTLRLPVNAEHLEQSIELEVWDEDEKTINGSDDPLGKLTIQMERLVREGNIEINHEKLVGVNHGSLMAKLSFEPADDASSNATNAPFSPPSRT